MNLYTRLISYISNRNIYRGFAIVFFIRIVIELITWLVFKSEGSPLLQLAYKILWIAGEMLILALFFNFLLLIQFKPLKILLRIILFILFLTSILWSIADPIIVKLAGDHLTPSLLHHFAGPQIFLSDELWLPIKNHPVMVLFGVANIFMALFLLYKLIKINIQYHASLKLHKSLILLIISAGMMLLPYFINGRFLQYPGEAIFIRNMLGWDQYQPTLQNIEHLQNFLSIPKESKADYPLMVKLKSSQALRPNIILFVIESLRGSDISTFNSAGGIEMTSFERFASDGIKFPYFISNGFPSTEGFLSLAMGVWPHSRERLVITHQLVEMPSLASQLGDKGYHSYRIEDKDDPEEEGYWIKPTFDYHVTLPTHKKGTEKNLIDTLIHIMKNDDNPVYIHLKTRNPHYPYEISNDSTNLFYQIGKPSENYPESMKMIDKHLNRLYNYLKESDKLKNTLVIITGDHSNILDKTHQTPLPFNETVWTGAIFAGDTSLIGPPRVDIRNCSQVDIATTLLSLTGGDCNWVGFGQNLLTPSGTDYSIAIRPAGVRLNHDGYAYILSRSEPTTYQIQQAFHDLKPKSKPMPPVNPEELFNLIDTWTYLVDEGRVYNSNK